MFNFVFLCPKRRLQFNSKKVRTLFSSVMTLNNWKMIAETRSYIFRWRSCFRRRRVCLSSLMPSMLCLEQGDGDVFQIHLSNVSCTGSEDSILKCSSNGWGNYGSCSHKDDAGVRCFKKGNCDNWKIPRRLIVLFSSSVRHARQTLHASWWRMKFTCVLLCYWSFVLNFLHIFRNNTEL